MGQSLFAALTVVVAVVAGGMAAVTGFGIGSLLTPLFALRLGLKLAVVCVAVPHFLGTLLRFGLMRRAINCQVLLTFGLASAAGGLAGALLQAHFSSWLLTVLFGSLLVLAGLGELVGRRLLIRGRPLAIGAGILSGAFGGLVGNQGGIRSAALLDFDLPRQAFVATATAAGLCVDGARLPVYIATRGRSILQQWPLLALAAAGVLAGTLIGDRLLRRLPERVFRRIVALIIIGLGIALIAGINAR